MIEAILGINEALNVVLLCLAASIHKCKLGVIYTDAGSASNNLFVERARLAGRWAWHTSNVLIEVSRTVTANSSS